MLIVDYSRLIYYGQDSRFGAIPKVLPPKAAIEHIAKSTMDCFVHRELEAVLVGRAERIVKESGFTGGFVDAVKNLDYALGSEYIGEIMLLYDSLFFSVASKEYTEEEASGFVAKRWMDPNSILYLPPEPDNYSLDLSARFKELMSNPRQ